MATPIKVKLTLIAVNVGWTKCMTRKYKWRKIWANLAI